MSKVKVVATIGPKTNNAAAISALREAGMNIARLNGSHSDLAWHAATIVLLHETVPDVPILMDIPGRKIRTHQLAHEPSFNRGDQLILTTDDSHDGSQKVPVNHPGLHNDLEAGNTILADDGTLRFTVMAIEGRDIVCRTETDGKLRSAKGINLPGIPLRTAFLNDRDREMLAFTREHGVTFVGISFVESAEQIEAIRTEIGTGGPLIVSKVENQPALDNLVEIVGASDALMIDRGDLAAETNLESMSLLQKQILREARLHSCPVIVATEMMHSMIDNPTPTRAEISDISNAVLDGASALMLSGETAIGAFPNEAVATMRRTTDTVSDHQQLSLRNEAIAHPTDNTHSVPNAMRDAIILICRRLPITKIVAVTISGYAARRVAAGLPEQPILALSNNKAAALSFNLLRGTEGVFVDMPFSCTSTDHLPECLAELWRRGKLVDDDLVLLTAVGYPKSGNRMNILETHLIADLADSLGWREKIIERNSAARQ